MRPAGEIYDQAGVPVNQWTDEFEKISELFLTEPVDSPRLISLFN